MRAAIILAAGRSRRFGSRDKLMIRYRGRRLVDHALRLAFASNVARVIVVTRCAKATRIRALTDATPSRLSIVSVSPGNDSRRQSLRAGLRSLRPIDQEAIILLADMPDLDRADVNAVARAGKENRRAVYRTAPGHPVLIRNPATALRRLDQGLAPLNASSLEHVPRSRSAIADIDRPVDLRPVKVA